MAFEDYKARGKQKPVLMGIADWAALHQIGKAIEATKGSLPSVRRDSPEWAAWRTWFHDHDMKTAWADSQPAERMMTVTMLWPPIDIDAEYSKWVKSKGKKLELTD